MMTIDKLKADLAYHTGSMNRYATIVKDVIYTEGIHNLAETAGAHWLIDIIASYQVEAPAKNTEFQIWKVNVKDGNAVVSMKEDTDTPILVRQVLTYTDFPEGEMEVYAIQEGPLTVILLKSEY